jgi:hypothetical protein
MLSGNVSRRFEITYSSQHHSLRVSQTSKLENKQGNKFAFDLFFTRKMESGSAGKRLATSAG